MERFLTTTALMAISAAALFSVWPAVAVAQTSNPTPPQLSRPCNQPSTSSQLISFGQVFDSGIGDPSVMTGTRCFVWGDNRSPHGFGVVPSVATGQYTTGLRAYFQADPPGYTEWFYLNHPDWIEYLSDGVTISYAFSDPRYTPLDFTNPDVVAFKENELMSLNTGQTWVDFDNFNLENPNHTAGHYAGTTAPCAAGARPACGGAWVAQFTGKPLDANWIAALEAYTARLVTDFHALGKQVMINDAEDVNPKFLRPSDHIALALVADGSMMEGYPMDGCTASNGWVSGRPTDAQFDAEFTEASVETAHTYFAVGKLCNDTIATMTNDEQSWATAAFLLAVQDPANNHLSVAQVGADSSSFTPYPTSVNPPIGDPIDQPIIGSRPYVRRFTHGRVVLNPQANGSLTYTLPAGDTYLDQFGNPVATTITLAPLTAVVLLLQ